MLRQIRERSLAGKRLDRADGLWLLTEAPLLDLGSVAQEVALPPHPGASASRSSSTRTRTTRTSASPTASSARSIGSPATRRPGRSPSRRSWRRSGPRRAQGATTVLLQGGHNPALPLDYYLSLVRETVRRFPTRDPALLHARPRSARSSDVTGKPVPEILGAAQGGRARRTLPGGGAEVLSEKVRRRIEPKKGGPAARGSTSTARRIARDSSRPRR